MAHRIVRHPTTSQGYQDVSCDACGSELKPVFGAHVDEDGAWESLQADKALFVRVDGGYGMFIDPILARGGDDLDPQPLDFLLCKVCAKKLVDENPWLAPTLKRYIDSGIGHVCDYDDRFVWVPYQDCMRSKTHGPELPEVRSDEVES